MGADLMPTEENRIFAAIGVLQSEMASLRSAFQTLESNSTAEHRTVHDIVVALSESMRVLTRTVEEMKPLTDDYRLKAAALAQSMELTEDYKLKKAEARGAAKFAAALWLAAGGIVMLAVTTLKDAIMAKPHP